MCSIKELVIDNQLTLQLPEVFFNTYYTTEYQYYIDEREKIYVVKKNDNIVIDIFLKCVLKRYLKEQKKDWRFNTCPICWELSFYYVEGFYEFGENPEYDFKNIKETLNHCRIYDHPFTNFVRENEKIELRKIQLDKVLKFFNQYVKKKDLKFYWCKHENITIYHQCEYIIDAICEQDLLYYNLYVLKKEDLFSQCPDCDRFFIRCFDCEGTKYNDVDDCKKMICNCEE
ncbi:31103_t:CDS:1 [Gigaspora margarita]|uniref:31103_t:CDS:1 n=1 Tax=Gigaspora margarita TaxID=4874 RepID=A0ABN7VY46_GIGMA|nr:31103_t:CDS:1 [Gigaspora margarita]